jgi:anti-sigma factor RsiW
MQCKEAHETLSALIDDELGTEQQHAARAHIAGCSLCAEVARDYRRIGDDLRAGARVPLPADLAHKVRARLASEARSGHRRGFPLVGGRLEFVDGRRIAALVYKRRRHVINVFMWPADGEPRAAAKASVLQGYNTLSWTAGGITFWAVSDLNAKELGELQGLL